MHFGYWDRETRSHSGSLTNLNAVLARRIGIQPGMRVLDAGCGVGGSAVWLGRQCDVEVVGISPVRSQIDSRSNWQRQSRRSSPPGGEAIATWDGSRSAVVTFVRGKSWSWGGNNWTKVVAGPASLASRLDLLRSGQSPARTG